MSVARITTINFKSKEDADKSIEDYSSNAPSELYIKYPPSPIVALGVALI